MRKNSHKENVIFNKTKNTNFIRTSNVVPKNVVQDIENIKQNKENIYIFNSGDKAEFLYERSCVNDLSFNYFQIYNKSVYLCLKEITTMMFIILSEKQINKSKNNYYITSEYENNLREDVVYDTGGNGSPSFSGYWILEAKEESHIKINSTYKKVEEGSIVIFESGSHTEFSGISKAISFNISTLGKLIGQYPQKWMPIIL